MMTRIGLRAISFGAIPFVTVILAVATSGAHAMPALADKAPQATTDRGNLLFVAEAKKKKKQRKKQQSAPPAPVREQRGS